MTNLLHHLLQNSCIKRPEAECLVDANRRFSYKTFAIHVDKLAAVFRQSGVQPGDRVAVHLGKSIEEAAVIVAASRAGAVFVNINSLLKGPQVKHILNDSGSCVLVTHRSRMKSLAPVLSETTALRAVLTVGPPLSDPSKFVPETISCASYAELVDAAQPLTDSADRIDDDPAGIIYTSGSTGAPKGVVVSHRNLLAGAQSVATYLENTAEDSLLSILPFSFDYGLNQLTTMLLVGGRLVLQRYLGPADILSAVQRERITGLAGIPPIWSALLQLEWDEATFADLRYITNSGGAFPVDQVRAYRERIPMTNVVLMYGLTEAFRSTYLDPREVDSRPNSMGKAIPNAEILVVNDQNQRCEPGEVGQLIHRGAHVALGYWNDPERTAERFKPNPLASPGLTIEEQVVFSGDYVKRDDAGFLYFVGRRDHMIKTRGFRVSPTEVEAYYHQTGLVQDVVAVGVPDPEAGQVIEVVLTLAKGVDVDQETLKKTATKDMPVYLVPRRTELKDSLPYNANGKLDRARIWKEVQAQAKEVSG